MSIANENEREIRKRELEEEFADLIGLPWSGRRYPGCYGIVQKYAQTRLGRSLKDFSGSVSYTHLTLPTTPYV